MKPIVQIRLQELGDAKRLYEILSNPNFTYFSSTPQSVKDEIKWLKNSFKELQKGISYNYAITLDGELVGGIGVKIFHHRKYIGEIGYFLEEKHWGKGIMVQAVKLLEEKCFNELGLTRLEAIMQPKNKASESVVIKSGFKKEGLLSKVIKDRDGNLKDVYLYAKTADAKEDADKSDEMSKYKRSGKYDINNVEILEGSIINADGYNSNLEEGYFHCVEYVNGDFGSNIYGDFDLIGSYKIIEVVGHCTQYKYLLDSTEEDAWGGNLGAVCK